MTILYIIIGILGGVIGGMGMGGGTVLIPMLVVFGGLSQTLSQSINLIAFVPMAIISLLIHSKNGLVKTKGVIYIIIPALVFSVIGSLIARSMNQDILQKLFGGFLVILAIISIFKKKENN